MRENTIKVWNMQFPLPWQFLPDFTVTVIQGGFNPTFSHSTDVYNDADDISEGFAFNAPVE